MKENERYFTGAWSGDDYVSWEEDGRWRLKRVMKYERREDLYYFDTKEQLDEKVRDIESQFDHRSEWD